MNTAANGQVTIGTLSRRSGVKVETVRYYERIGLLPAPPRSAGGYRLYGADDLRRLRFVRRARQLGFSLDEVRELLGLAGDARASCAQVKRLTLRHLDEVRAKLADLRRLEGVLDETARRCTGGRAPACPVLDALFDGAPTASASPRPGGAASR